jgi:hypothetical protein
LISLKEFDWCVRLATHGHDAARQREKKRDD